MTIPHFFTSFFTKIFKIVSSSATAVNSVEKVNLWFIAFQDGHIELEATHALFIVFFADKSFPDPLKDPT